MFEAFHPSSSEASISYLKFGVINTYFVSKKIPGLVAAVLQIFPPSGMTLFSYLPMWSNTAGNSSKFLIFSFQYQTIILIILSYILILILSYQGSIENSNHTRVVAEQLADLRPFSSQESFLNGKTPLLLSLCIFSCLEDLAWCLLGLVFIGICMGLA